jgi:hypothetical protein
VSRRVSRAASFVALSGALVALVLGLGAQRARAADGELFVTFRENHTITVTLPDGTPVGAPGGGGAVIPAGPYTLHLEDSVGVEGPEFDLRGPGVMVVDDMFFGESPSATHRVTFQPSTTYTWRNNERPDVVFAFNTSSTVSGGTSPGGSSSGTGSSTTSKSKDIVGSGIVAFRGTLSGDVSTTGKLTLVFKGKAVTNLKSGRYKLAVLDETSRAAFKLQKLGNQPVTLTGLAFVGRHTATLTLKPGQWMFYSSAGKKSFFVVIA